MYRLLPGLLLLCFMAGPARAEVSFKFSGWVSSDIRFRLNGAEDYNTGPPSQWQLLPYGFSRNENRIRGAVQLALGAKVKAVVDAELLMFGFSDLSDLNSATLRATVDPYNLEVHAAYIDVNNILPHVDLRIGRQVVPWGAADKFNPVSNLNTLDLSDPLLFGRALANNMVRLDWNPVGDLSFTAVVVPIFRPAQLPRTAPLALLDPLRPAPVLDPGIADAIDVTRRLVASGLTVNANVLQPEPSINNAQVGLRAAAKLLGQDVAVSYYRGRFGVPSPAWTVLSGTLAPKVQAVANLAVMYPQVDILGLEAAGSIEKLGGVGWWAEAAVNFPTEVRLGIYDEVLGPLAQLEYVANAAGSYGLPTRLPLRAGADRAVVIASTPFVKSTLGADYTLFSGHLYMNFQYVHGFIDEFGAGRAARPRINPMSATAFRRESLLGDYLVAGVDLKVLSDRVLFRFFGVVKLPSVDLTTGRWDDYAPTGVLFPQIVWTVWDGTELMLGSFVMLGDRSTKFGDPAAGATEVFAKARVSF